MTAGAERAIREAIVALQGRDETAALIALSAAEGEAYYDDDTRLKNEVEQAYVLAGRGDFAHALALVASLVGENGAAPMPSAAVAPLLALPSHAASSNGHTPKAPMANASEVVAELLDRLTAELCRYVVLSREQALACALWVFHTHAIAATDTTPYLNISSAQKESGKTRLLEVLERLVARPLAVANISDAALFRAIEEMQPTLLFDEVDAIFGPKARDREDMRGMLNSGYRRGGYVLRVGGKRMNELERFTVFAAKALAGIGSLPDTIASRTIPIRLKRRAPGEKIERFRLRIAGPKLEPLHAELAEAADLLLDQLSLARPALPDELADRMQDAWEPLLAIADLAGPDYGERARHAAVKLCTSREVEDDAIGVHLLTDIRAIFAARDADRLPSHDLLAELCAIEESPWATYRRDEKPITAALLGRLLRPFDIRSRNVRLHDGTTPKGYLAKQFEDAFVRYLRS